MSVALGRECTVAPGFEAVAWEFQRNFSERGELGAAFAAVVGGRPVVDLWGGVADRELGKPWERDTMQVIFSGTKGLVAACLLILIDRGELELDAPVCGYWPEFGAAGKEAVTVRHLATHTARLPGLASPVTVEDVVDDRRAAELLAAQPQFADPRAARAYHPLTFGWLCGELVRRIDGRSIGRFFAEEIAGPLELDLFIGLPEDLEARVGRLELAATWPSQPELQPDGVGDDELARAVWVNPEVWTRSGFPWNSRAYHAAEIPGAGGIGTARSVAKFYGALDRLISPEVLSLGATELERRVDPFTPDGEAVEDVFGVGFGLQGEQREFGPPADAFGHGGAGGSMHGRWPSQDVGFSYTMNLLHDDYPDGDPRSGALLGALWGCLCS